MLTPNLSNSSNEVDSLESHTVRESYHGRQHVMLFSTRNGCTQSGQSEMTSLTIHLSILHFDFQCETDATATHYLLLQ